MKLLPAVSAVCVLLASGGAYAGNFADAAISNGQAGGNAQREMDLLGSPQTYADPYGAPTDGRGAARGKAVTGAQTADGVSPTDKLLAQQNGYVGNPGAGAQLRRGLGRDDAAGKGALTAQGAAASLYPSGGLKPPANAARVREIYKSPY